MSQLPTNAGRLSIYGTQLGEDAQPSSVQSPCPSCGCKTVGGVEPVPGGSVAKINQDRGLAIYPWNSDAKAGLFGVYDGHGRVGEKVSEFVIQNLPQQLLLRRETLDKDPGQALSEAYLKVDDELAAEPGVDATVSGTTAVTCLIKENHLWLANSGDSRAIVVRKKPGTSALEAVDLTIDHKPDSPAEMKRITNGWARHRRCQRLHPRLAQPARPGDGAFDWITPQRRWVSSQSPRSQSMISGRTPCRRIAHGIWELPARRLSPTSLHRAVRRCRRSQRPLSRCERAVDRLLTSSPRACPQICSARLLHAHSLGFTLADGVHLPPQKNLIACLTLYRPRRPHGESGGGRLP